MKIFMPVALLMTSAVFLAIPGMIQRLTGNASSFMFSVFTVFSGSKA